MRHVEDGKEYLPGKKDVLVGVSRRLFLRLNWRIIVSFASSRKLISE